MLSFSQTLPKEFTAGSCHFIYLFSKTQAKYILINRIECPFSTLFVKSSQLLFAIYLKVFVSLLRNFCQIEMASFNPLFPSPALFWMGHESVANKGRGSAGGGQSKCEVEYWSQRVTDLQVALRSSLFPLFLFPAPSLKKSVLLWLIYLWSFSKIGLSFQWNIFLHWFLDGGHGLMSEDAAIVLIIRGYFIMSLLSGVILPYVSGSV